MGFPESHGINTPDKGMEGAILTQTSTAVRHRVLSMLSEPSPQEFYRIICAHIHWNYDKELRKDERPR